MRKFVLILSLFLGFVASAAASDLYTHTTAEPERSFRVAATWWLPDYQSDTRDFAKRSSGNDKVAGDIDNTCANYNKSWQTTIGADMECDAVKPLPNLTCYKNCRCKNVVSVGTGEQCNRYCLGTQCVSKSCRAGVSVGSGETCTERCASNSNICTAKSCNATVSVGTGEQCTATCGGNCVAKSCKSGVSVAAGETCTERCASNSGVCTAKSCNATVSVGTGEQCNTTCGGNCVAKSCKGSVTVSTGEQCTQRCASNSGVCTAKTCKSTATVNTGEYCTERCAADNSCTAKACKSSVSVGVGETCSEHCSSNSSTCTAKSCNSAVGVNSSTEVCTQTCASDASVCTAKRAKTCAERSMKDCNGSCIATAECCGGCPTGQTCQNSVCISNRSACYNAILSEGKYIPIETVDDLREVTKNYSAGTPIDVLLLNSILIDNMDFNIDSEITFYSMNSTNTNTSVTLCEDYKTPITLAVSGYARAGRLNSFLQNLTFNQLDVNMLMIDNVARLSINQFNQIGDPITGMSILAIAQSENMPYRTQAYIKEYNSAANFADTARIYNTYIVVDDYHGASGNHFFWTTKNAVVEISNLNISRDSWNNNFYATDSETIFRNISLNGNSLSIDLVNSRLRDLSKATGSTVGNIVLQPGLTITMDTNPNASQTNCILSDESGKPIQYACSPNTSNFYQFKNYRMRVTFRNDLTWMCGLAQCRCNQSYWKAPYGCDQGLTEANLTQGCTACSFIRK